MLILSAGENVGVKLFLRLAITLGWRGDVTVINSSFEGVKLSDLVPYKELCIHLDQISTTDNIQLESPSILLRAVPVKGEKYNSGRTESFSSLQYLKIKAWYYFRPQNFCIRCKTSTCTYRILKCNTPYYK